MSTEATTVPLKKRERTQNWLAEEKRALLALIKLHVSAIESKKIDQAASVTKALAWQKIHSVFRGRFSTDRGIVRMREQWRRMKSQARMEIEAYAEKIQDSGPEVAAKSRPSNLSIEVWRLIENVRRNDRSDDNSSRDTEDPNRTSTLRAILDDLVGTPEMSAVEREINSGSTYHTEDEGSRGEIPSRKRPSDEPSPRKQPRTSAMYGPMGRKITRSNGTPYMADAAERDDDTRNDSSCGRSKTVQQIATWMYESAQREHEIKLRTLQIELERAELQRQTAANKLRTSEIEKQMIEDQTAAYFSQVKMAGERGSGAGKGGGGGGTIRDAGGSFGKMEAAHEDQYFYNLQKEQLKKMQESLHDEISFHEEQIKRHQEAINRHKKRMSEMADKEH